MRKGLRGLGIFFMGLATTAAFQLGKVKEWHFETPQGGVRMRLSSYADMGKPAETSLAFQSEEKLSTIATRNLAQFLGSGLKEMPSLGYDPSNLVNVSVSLTDSELHAGVNHAVEQSGIWRSCVNRKRCYQAQKVADRYLDSVNAFSEFDHHLQLYGLRRKRVSTDDLVCGPISTTASATVSCGGLVHIQVVRVEKPTISH